MALEHFPWFTNNLSDLRLFSLTSGSGHGEVRLFLALDGVAWFSPSCFLFLLRFGFSASWLSVKTKCLDNDNRVL